MANATYGVVLPMGWVASTSPFPHTANGVSGAGPSTALPMGWSGNATPPLPNQAWGPNAGVQGGYGYAGLYKVVGQTTDNGSPVQRWVYLHPQIAPSLLIASAYTDINGNFSFLNLAPGNYIVLGVDPSGNTNAVVYDFVTAASM